MTQDLGDFAAAVPPQDDDLGDFAAAVPKTSALQRIGDVGLAAAKGVVGAGEAAVGIADIATGGRAGQTLERLGYRPKQTKQAIDELMSPAGQADATAVQQAKGFFPTVAEVATRPWFIANVLGESAPSMVGGLAVGRGIQAVAPKVSGAVAGALGEGAVSAGSTAETIRQETGALDDKGTLASLGAGAAVASTGAIGNLAARAAKVASPDTVGLLNRGLEKVEGNLIGRIAKGAGIEAAEEVVQSGAEQALQNVGTGRPLAEGVPEQMAIGGVAGGVMGGAFGAQGRKRGDVEQNDPSVQAPPGPLQAAAEIGKANGTVPGESASQPQYGGLRGLIAGAAQKYGVDPTAALVIASIETGGRFNADAANPKSSARGVFQFMDATRKMFPEVTPEQWQDPQVQAEYGARFIAQTNQRLGQFLGRALSTGEAYMGHLLGAYGAAQLLTADPNRPVQEVIAQYDPKRAAEIVRLNGMKGLTAGQAVAKWNGIAEQHASRLGLEAKAFPFSDQKAAQMAATAAAREGRMLEVVEHPNVPGRFAALPPTGGDPNEEQRASKVPLVADLPRYDQDPNEPQAPETIQGQAQEQAGAAAPAGPAQPIAQAAAPGAAAGGSAAAPVADVQEPIQGVPGVPPNKGQGPGAQAQEAAAAAQDLIAQRGLTPGQDYNPDPTPAQAEAGNYKKAHERWNGLDLTIENPVGSTRRSKDPANPWEVTMEADYGYIKRTRGADSSGPKAEQIDFYKPMDALDDAPVWVIDQTDPATGLMDEHKVVFGVNAREEAELIYDQHFSDGSGPSRRHTVTEMTMPEFKAWLKSGTTDNMPAVVAAPQVREQQAVEAGVMPAFELPQQGLFKGLPQAAKFARDNALDATPVAAEGGYALAPNVKPQQLSAEDDSRMAELRTALVLTQNDDTITPLRGAPSPDAALAAHIAERVFGKRVIHLESNRSFNGVAHKDRIYLAGAEKPALAVVGHELAHQFEGTKLHQQLVGVFAQYGRNPDALIESRRQYEQRGEKVRRISKAYARNEVIADLNGAMWIDPKFWGELLARDENLFRQVAYKFMELATKAVQAVAGAWIDAGVIVSDVQAARAAIAQAWADHLRAGGKSGPQRMMAIPIMSRTIQVGGKRRPIENSLGQSIVPASQGYKAQKAFYDWFGDSKVVDEQGRPLVVYHGAGADVQAFAKMKRGVTGFFFSSDAALASMYADKDAGNVIPAHIALKNPLVVDAKGRGFDDVPIPMEGVTGSTDDLARTAKKAKYDGVIIKNVVDIVSSDAKPADVYVAFRPEQIKSAIGNSGTFDPANPDIRFSRKAEIPARVARHLTDSERSKLRADAAQRLVELFDRLPSGKEMAAVAWAGRAKRGWYERSARAMLDVFGPDAPRFVALLAAMSPQTSVQMNLENATRVWSGWIKAGRPNGRDEIIKVMGDNVVGNKLADSVLPAWINNSVRALADEDPGSTVLSGPKVNSFMENLRGNVNEVTNDAWMAAFAAVDQTMFGGKLNKAGTDPGKGSGYLAMSARVREASSVLSKMTGEPWSPAEAQETIWSWAKALYEMQDATEGGYGAREIIENGELSDELIAATPDFGSLLLEEKYGQPLRSAGYGERIDSLAAGRNDGPQDTRPGGQAAPFDERAQRGFERRAADRLERLRDERARSEAATRAEARGIRFSRGVGGGDELLEQPRRPDQGDGATRPLIGLPATVQVDGREVTFGPFEPAHAAARAYMAKAGLAYDPPKRYARVDRERAKRIADAFERMRHDPGHPLVQRAYAAMIAETKAQYQAALDAGLKVEFIDFAKQGDPYGNPRNAILDVVNNNHLWVYPTDDGFGTSDDFDPVDNPLLALTDFEISGKKARVNDIFRAVHDYFGHIKDGVGFRADGEENAWRSHSAMYSPLARLAMTTETRGQNSWLNFGPHGEKNRTAKTEDTIFAGQKIGVLPWWVSDEGRTDDPRFSRKTVGPFYSALAQSIEELSYKTLTPAAWNDAITALLNKGAVKKDEVEWSGLREWLTMQAERSGDRPGQGDLFPGMKPKLSKQELLDYLDANGVQVEEKLISGKGSLEVNFGEWETDDPDEGYLEEQAEEYEIDNVIEDMFSDYGYNRRGVPDADDFREKAREELANGRLDEARSQLEEEAEEGEAIDDDDVKARALELVDDESTEERAKELAKDDQEVLDAAIERARTNYYEDEYSPQSRSVTVEVNNKTFEYTWNNYDGDHQLYSHTSGESWDIRGRRIDEADIEREIREHLEEQGIISGEDSDESETYDDYILQGPSDNYRVLLLTVPKAFSGDESFTESHWDTPNVIAHARVDDRKAGGKRVLFIEEIQSDWAQKGREQGFDGSQLRLVDGPRDALLQSMRDAGKMEYIFKRGDNTYSGFGATEEDARQDVMDVNTSTRGQPLAPFVEKTDAWVTLTLKRLTKLAVDEGYDSVAFITGRQSAHRWNFARVVRSIRWASVAGVSGDRPLGQGEREVVLMRDSTGYSQAARFVVDDKGIIKNSSLSELDAKPLDQAIGKALAAKIMEAERGELEGVDLEVGGHGQREFYDKIVPAAMNKILAKLGGGKLQEIKMADGRDPSAYMPWVAKSGGASMYTETEEAARAWLAKHNAQGTVSRNPGNPDKPGIQLGFDITPEMKAKAEGGFPLFSRKVTGAARAYTPEQQQAMRNVGFDIKVPSIKERVQAVRKDAAKKLVQGIFDQFSPLKEVGAQAYMLARLSKGASGAFEVLLRGGKLKLTDGVYDFDDKAKGGVVERLLIPLQGEHHDFLRWVAANRAEFLMAQGRENLFSPQDIADMKTLADGQLGFDYTIRTGPQAGTTTRDRRAAYADSQRIFNEFNKNVLDMAEQSGMFDGQERRNWEHEFYVPFYRVAEEMGETRGVRTASALVRQQAIKRLKGGTDKLSNDLLDNTLRNWAHLLEASAKNRAAKAALEAAEAMGKAINAPQAVVQQLGAATGNKKGVVWFMDGGQKRHFLVDDPFILEAITAMEYAGMRGPVMNAMSAMKHWLTIGVTASPHFKIKNLIRDSMQVVATSKISPNVAANIAQGWAMTSRTSDEYMRLLAGGGTIHFGTMLEGSEAKRVQALVESGVKDSTILNNDAKLKAFWRKVIEPALTYYNEIGNRGEAVNRASLYKQMRDKGMNHAEASLLARDLMDFSMQGTFTTVRFLSQVVPFFNARLQGLYKLGRSSKENKARMASVVGAAALASILLAAGNEDDEDWQKREDWDRNSYWWFKVGGTAYRIPKPFEIGAFATLAERTWELAFSDNMDGERYRRIVRDLIFENLSMNPVPQMLKPIVEVYANRDSYTGREIESIGMERLEKEYRFKESTTQAARAASKAMNAVTRLAGVEGLSPVQIDHLLRGYFGWLGAASGAVTDAILRPATGQPTRPTPDYAKTATGGLVAGTVDAPSRYVSEMFERAKKVEQTHATWRQLMKTDPAKAGEYFQSNVKTISRYPLVSRMKENHSNLEQQIRAIERGTTSGDEKREAIRGLRDQQANIAKLVTTALMQE